MKTYLDAAEVVLSEVEEPLSPREITVRAVEAGVLVTNGKTPWQTMKSKLSTDILEKSERSMFMRTEPGKFALRSWTTHFTEYVATRFEKSAFDEDILVFDRTMLGDFEVIAGDITRTTDLTPILRACRPMLRSAAEDDFSVIQLVSVFVVHYEGQILTHKRTRRLPESRLHGFYSIGFGGHLNPEDVPRLFLNEFSDASTAFPFLMRELEEELILRDEPEISFFGLLYDESRKVSQQHLGLVYTVAAKSDQFEIGERGFLMDPKLETLDEIESRIDQFENWSRLIASTPIAEVAGE